MKQRWDVGAAGAAAANPHEAERIPLLVGSAALCYYGLANSYADVDMLCDESWYSRITDNTYGRIVSGNPLSAVVRTRSETLNVLCAPRAGPVFTLILQHGHNLLADLDPAGRLSVEPTKGVRIASLPVLYIFSTVACIFWKLVGAQVTAKHTRRLRAIRRGLRKLGLYRLIRTSKVVRKLIRLLVREDIEGQLRHPNARARTSARRLSTEPAAQGHNCLYETTCTADGTEAPNDTAAPCKVALQFNWRSGFLKHAVKMAVSGMSAFFVAGLPATADVVVDTQVAVGDFSTGHPGVELLINYTITNTSANSWLTQFVLSVGSADGVSLNSWTGPWSVSVGEHTIDFSYYGSGKWDSFSVVVISTNLATRTGWAGGSWNNGDDSFSVSVAVPTVNTAPLVFAASNPTVTLPAGAALAGSVIDATTVWSANGAVALTNWWSVANGPGPVSFADASATSTTASFTEPGAYVLALAASDGELAATSTVAVTVLDCFAEWQTRTGVSGAAGDPDGDGIPNLLEYAYGLPPLTNNAAAGPRGAVTNGYLTLRYQQSKWAADVTCVAEVSGDLTGGWSSAGADVEQQWQVWDNPDGNTQTIIARDKTAIGAASKRFMRLRVTGP